MTLYSLRLPRRFLYRLMALAMLCAALTLAHSAMTYAQNEIVPDPNAKHLDLLWVVQGPEFGDAETRARVGSGVGGLGDIYGTGTNAWAVNYALEGYWRIYNRYMGDAARDTVPVQKIRGGGEYPIVGDFWGTGKNAVVFVSGSHDTSDSSTKSYIELHAHRTESNWIDTAIATTLDVRTLSLPTEVTPRGYVVADLDKDHADELILPLGLPHLSRMGGGEFWIFKGGSDFHLHTPTRVIPTPLQGDIYAYAGDFDGDNHTDIVTWVDQANGGPHRLIFYYGDGTLDGYGKQENRRVLTLGEGYPRAHFGIEVLDCDGDGRADLVMNTVDSPEQGVYIFRSRTGKNARTRSYLLNDADNVLAIRARYRSVGHLNDSTQRFDMLMLYDDSVYALMLSGGEHGPDNTYDAYCPNAFFDKFSPLPDIDGDGWDDLIAGNPTMNFGPGIAVIIAGGPTIPRDPTMGVEVIAGEGHESAFSTWPNPIRDEFHIAWRGDLKRMPQRFIVRDILGHDIATSTVEPGAAVAQWSCATVNPGVYFLSMYDSANTLIATIRVVKCE